MSGDHPIARFVSTSIRFLGSDRFEARGPLTIKGRTGEVVAAFTVRNDRGHYVYEGGLPIRRLQYDIGTGIWKDTDTVADEVQLRFRIYQPAPPPAAR